MSDPLPVDLPRADPIAVIVIASIGSHMPRRYRYYSILDRRPVTMVEAPDRSLRASRVR